MKEGDGTIRLGAINLSPALLSRIEAWCAALHSYKASVEAITEIGPARHDLYLLEVGPDSASHADHGSAFESFTQAAGSIPLLAIATHDDAEVAEQVAASGFAAFLVMSELDAGRFERAIAFALQQRRRMDALRAREMALAEAAERARQTLANLLHDGPLQDLIGTRFLVGALGPSTATGEVQESLQGVVQWVRALCSELKPPALGPFGLEKAIRAHAQVFVARYPEMEVTLELENDRQLLPEWARYALFRLYQAAVDNVVKHAQATQMSVRLRMGDEFARLSVVDDGQGFELPPQWLDFALTGRYGFLMMQERADALRGKMMVQSSLGSGARISVQVPLDQPPFPLIVPMESVTSSPPLLSQAIPITPSVPDRNG